MSYKKLKNLPIYDLKTELSYLLEEKKIEWKGNQICLNCTRKNSDDFSEGVGSLYYDWSNVKKINDKNGNMKIDVPLRENSLKESDFKYFCNVFSNTLFEEVYLELEKKYKLGRVRLMKSVPKTCLSWHKDTSKRIHFPIKTQSGCFMIIDNEVFYLEENNWYITDTEKYHTAVNASKEERIHLVATVL
jgi:hypothetical protein